MPKTSLPRERCRRRPSPAAPLAQWPPTPSDRSVDQGRARKGWDRPITERAYNIVRWTDMLRGGHFAAMEEPELFVGVRAWAWTA